MQKKYILLADIPEIVKFKGDIVTMSPEGIEKYKKVIKEVKPKAKKKAVKAVKDKPNGD